MARLRKRIVLLGAGGQLGHAIQTEFDRCETDILPTTRESLDIRQTAALTKYLQKYKPEVVINAAGCTNLMGAQRQLREYCWQVNTQAVDGLVKACVQLDVPLIHISTSDVFGDLAGPKLKTELDVAAPMSWYAQTKVMGDAYVSYWGGTSLAELHNRRFRYWIIRTGLLFEKPIREARNLLHYYFNLATIGAKREAAVPTDVYRSVCYAPHLAQSIIWLIQNKEEIASGTYNVCNEGHASLYSIMDLIQDRVGRRLHMYRADWPAASKTLDIDPTLLPRYSGLCCDKWHEIAPSLPSLQQAVAEFAKCLSH